MRHRTCGWRVQSVQFLAVLKLKREVLTDRTPNVGTAALNQDDHDISTCGGSRHRKLCRRGGERERLNVKTDGDGERDRGNAGDRV